MWLILCCPGTTLVADYWGHVLLAVELSLLVTLVLAGANWVIGRWSQYDGLDWSVVGWLGAFVTIVCLAVFHGLYAGAPVVHQRVPINDGNGEYSKRVVFGGQSSTASDKQTHDSAPSPPSDTESKSFWQPWSTPDWRSADPYQRARKLAHVAQKADRAEPSASGADGAPDVGPSADHESSDTGVGPGVSKQDVREVLGELRPAARECYNTLLDDFPNVSGQLIIGFDIVAEDGRGRVEVANIDKTTTLYADRFHNCVSQGIGELKFPTPSETIHVEFPMHFTPGDNNQPQQK